jgi:hypothetical protein
MEVDLNGHLAMITPGFSMNDRQPASKRQGVRRHGTAALHEEAHRHTLKVARPRTAGPIDQQQ